jgi:hypothetical protein
MTTCPRKCPRVGIGGTVAESLSLQGVHRFWRCIPPHACGAENVPVVPANVPGFVPMVSGGRP